MGSLVNNVASDKTKLPVTAWWFVIFSLLFVIGVVERVYGIDRQSLWSDELFAVVASHKPLLVAWQSMLSDSHPPGYLLFMYYSLPLTGYTDIGVRLHALMFGVLWMPLVFLCCRRWFSTEAALLAMALLASGYNAIYYSQEARAYSWFVATGLLHVMCLFDILFSENAQRRHRVGFIASGVVLLYLHYSGFVFLCAEMLLCGLLWLFGYYKQGMKLLLWLFGVPLLLYAPWLEVMYNNMVAAPQDWSVSAVPDAAEVYNTLQRLLGPDDAHMRFYWLMMTFATICLIRKHWQQGMSTSLLVAYSLMVLAVVPVLAFYVESLLATPLFEKRYFLMTVVFVAMLTAWCYGQCIQHFDPVWKKILTTLIVIWLTWWGIQANAAFGLYTKKDKDPVREAVAIVKEDVIKSAIGKHYTTIMTHEWFEPYLLNSGINVDNNWRYRYYYVPQQVENIENYLESHKGKEYLYYLSLRQANSTAALVALKQRYQLVSHAVAEIETGVIDVFKFNVKKQPDAEQIKDVGTNPSNEVAKMVAQDIGSAAPSSYHILMTHDWMQPYLRHNGVATDEDAGNYLYVVNAQADGVSRYLREHPAVNTLYYLALQEPNAEGAELMLQMQYRLVSEKTVKVSVGDMSILKFNVKESPVIDEGAMQRMHASRTYRVVEWLKQDIAQTPAASLAVVTANLWVESYLKLGGIPVDEKWIDRNYAHAQYVGRVTHYLNQHPAVQALYYVGLREPETERAAQALQQAYTLKDKASIEVGAGTIDIYKFDTRSR